MDKSPVVASAVLVSAMHLLNGNTELVKRWTNEIQEAVQSKSAMVRTATHACYCALAASFDYAPLGPCWQACGKQMLALQTRCGQASAVTCMRSSPQANPAGAFSSSGAAAHW